MRAPGRARARRPGAAAAVAVVAGAALVGSGCAPAAAPGAGEAARLRVDAGFPRGPAGRSDPPGYLFELAAPAAAAWAELPSVYAALELPLAFVDEGRRTLGNDGWAVPPRVAGERPSHWLDCGLGLGATPNADVYDVIMAVRSVVGSTGSGTVVATSVGGTASPRDASGGVVACSSRGTLEKRIGELLDERLPNEGP